LLLTAVTWLHHTGSNIILLSEVYWNSWLSIIGKGGNTQIKHSNNSNCPHCHCVFWKKPQILAFADMKICQSSLVAIYPRTSRCRVLYNIPNRLDTTPLVPNPR
jgi:hypothetical protein